MLSVFAPGGAGLVLGGARSGKSAFAEQLADNSGRKKVYVATSQIWDTEMEQRVSDHKARRGADWDLVEEPTALAQAIAANASKETCILVDCLTLWLTNLMMAERDVKSESVALCETVQQLPEQTSVIFVSNEVGLGIVPMDKMAREFRDHAGRLHQLLAAQVQHVWFVTAGLPQKLK